MQSVEACFYAFFTVHWAISTSFLCPQNHTQFAYFIERSIMDVVFVLGAVGLWLAMVLMVVGLQKLEKPEVKRS